jgi:hypothetical protein
LPRFHYENQEVPTIEIIKEDLFSKTPNALLFSTDLNESNLDSENLRSMYDLNILPTGINLHDVIDLKKNGKPSTFVLFTHLNHFDKPTYKEIFYTLLKFRSKLLDHQTEKVYLRNPSTYNERLKLDMIMEMIHFIFYESTVKIILVDKSKIKLETPEQIKKILAENHSSSIVGHSGFRRTYNRIKANYKWKNMKRDVKEFVRTCESCQQNKTIAICAIS